MSWMALVAGSDTGGPRRVFSGTPARFAILSLLAAACGADGRPGTMPTSDGASGPDGGSAGQPLYAVYTQVRTQDGRTNYLALTPSLGAGSALDLGNAAEIPGYSRFFAPESGGFFAIGNGEDMTITRYDVTDERHIHESGRLSLAGVGVTRMHYRAVFLDATRAYYVDNTAGQIVVWNPQDMTITRTFELPDPVVDGYEGYETILPFYKFPVVDGRLFIPVSWIDRAGQRARHLTGLVVVDTRAESVVSYTETERCPAATELAFDDNGDVYFSTDYYHSLYSAEVRGLTRPGCVLRIRAGEQTFDQTYLVRLTDIAGGRATISLTDGAAPGTAYISVLDEAQLSWSSFVPEPLFDEAWEWWLVDLRTGSAHRDDRIPKSGPGVASLTVGSERYVVRSIEDRSRSQLYRLSSAGDHSPGFVAPGYISGLARVR